MIHLPKVQNFFGLWRCHCILHMLLWMETPEINKLSQMQHFRFVFTVQKLLELTLMITRNITATHLNQHLMNMAYVTHLIIQTEVWMTSFKSEYKNISHSYLIEYAIVWQTHLQNTKYLHYKMPYLVHHIY